MSLSDDSYRAIDEAAKLYRAAALVRYHEMAAKGEIKCAQAEIFADMAATHFRRALFKKLISTYGKQ